MNALSPHAWWILALRGGLAVLFGALALTWPGLTLQSLITLFAFYALLSGAASVYAAVSNRKADDDWGLLLLLGLTSIVAGVIAIVHPALTALVLILVIAANAIVTGVLDIAMAIRLRKTIRNEWLLILSGAAAVVFGVLVFLYPGAGAFALVGMIGLYAILVGMLLLALAMRVRTRARAGMTPMNATDNRRTVAERRHAADRRHAVPAHP